MKTLLLFISFLVTGICHSQTIRESKFDKFDSLYTVTTIPELLTNKKATDASLTVAVANYRFMQKRFEELTRGFKPVVYSSLTTPKAISLRKDESNIKIEFEDGQIKEYQHSGDSKIYTAKEKPIIYFTISNSDELIYKDITAVRVTHGSGYYDFKIEDNKKSLIRKMISITKQEDDRNNPKL